MDKTRPQPVMNKSQLRDALAAQTDVPKSLADAVLHTLIAIVEEKVEAGHIVQISGFLTIKPTLVAGRNRHNPHTGATTMSAPRWVAKIKAGSHLKDAMAKYTPES